MFKNVKYVDETMSAELKELMAGEHANAVKALVYESANSGFRKGIIYGLVAVAASTVIGTSAVAIGNGVIKKYQKA